MNDPIQHHLAQLEANLGGPGFDAAFGAMKSDRRMKGSEVAAVASRFMSRTPPSAPKRESLRRIYSLHASLIDSANKIAWQRGKSAA